MPDPDDRVASTLAGIRDRHAARIKNAPGLGADPVDFRSLLAALEAVLAAVDRLDTERGDYGHLVNRHEAAAAFRRVITAALTGKEAGDA